MGETPLLQLLLRRRTVACIQIRNSSGNVLAVLVEIVKVHLKELEEQLKNNESDGIDNWSDLTKYE